MMLTGEGLDPWARLAAAGSCFLSTIGRRAVNVNRRRFELEGGSKWQLLASHRAISTSAG